MRAERQPRPVVAREDDERARVDARGFHRVENAAGARVDLFDDVAVHAGGAVAGKLRRPRERDVRKVVREVQEERPAAILLDESHRFLRVALRQRTMVHRLLDDVAVAHQRHVPVFGLRIVVGGALQPIVARRRHPHVVRIGQTEPIIEALIHRQELAKLSEMPLAHDRGRVPARLQHFRNRDLFGRQALCGVVAKHFRRRAGRHAVRAAANRQPSGQERGPARRAHRLDVEVRPLLSLGRHAIEARRADVRAAERSEIAVPQVVGEDDDDVRRRLRRLRGERRDGDDRGEEQKRSSDDAHGALC